MLSAVSKMVLLVSMITIAVEAVWPWDGTHYDSTLDFECLDQFSRKNDDLFHPIPPKAISRIKNQHSNIYEDRRWAFECRDWDDFTPGGFTHCTWPEERYTQNDYTANGTEYDNMDFTCPNGGILAGMYSVPHKDEEDHRWMYKCCHTISSFHTHCRETVINEFDRYMDYTVPDGFRIAGMKSHHDNPEEDRTWTLKLCRTHN